MRYRHRHRRRQRNHPPHRTHASHPCRSRPPAPHSGNSAAATACVSYRGTERCGCRSAEEFGKECYGGIDQELSDQ